ncbi:uncharacterized protein [Ptychodera flava]|uniref:uncharacterized protein n=1 Tax=Ptychodera flava TaxID=63121 RepID=UPI00396A6053
MAAKPDHDSSDVEIKGRGTSKETENVSPVKSRPKSSDIDFIRRLQKELKFHYNKLQRLQPMPWLKRITVDLGKTFSSLQLIDRKTRYEMRNIGMKLIGISTGQSNADHKKTLPSRIDIGHQQVFSPFDIDGDKIPKRVLLEGEPGIGKTTLCRKLAYDWKMEEAYISHFGAIFIVNVRKFKGSLKMALQQQGLLSRAVKLDELWHYIEKNQSEFLWVIDGLDELYPNVKDEIVKLVAGHTFPNSTVLATSRICQWETFFKNENIENLFDREICNVGFVPKATDDFMKMYFKSKPSTFDESDLLTFVQKDKGRLRDLTRNPLICMYLCFLWEDKLSREILMKSEHIDFCQVLIKMRKSVSRRFYDSYKGGNISLSAFEDRVQKIRHLAFDSLMKGKQQYSINDINELFSSDFEDDDTFFQMGILSQELGEADEKEVTLFEFPHKAIQDELAGEYINLLTEAERDSFYNEIVSVPARHQMLVFMSALCRGNKDYEDTLGPMFQQFNNAIDKFPYYSLVAYDPFNEPALCLPLECLSVSGCSDALAAKVADVYHKRGKELWFCEDTLLTSYEDNIRGLSCLVDTTNYRQSVKNLVVSGWGKTNIPSLALHIVQRLESVITVVFLDVPYISISEMIKPDFVSMNPVEQFIVLRTGIEENEIDSFHDVVRDVQVSGIDQFQISNFGSDSCISKFHFIRHKHSEHQETKHTPQGTDSLARSLKENVSGSKSVEIRFEVVEVQAKPLNMLCSKFDVEKLKGERATLSFSNPDSILTAVDILNLFHCTMSRVEVGVSNVLEKALVLVVLQGNVVRSDLEYAESEKNDFIDDVTLVTSRSQPRCKWFIGVRRSQPLFV